MNLAWGVIMAAVGIFMLVSGITRSNFIVYRLLVARSKMFWGENVHRFYQVVGVVITLLGILAALGVIW